MAGASLPIWSSWAPGTKRNALPPTWMASPAGTAVQVTERSSSPSGPFHAFASPVSASAPAHDAGGLAGALLVGQQLGIGDDRLHEVGDAVGGQVHAQHALGAVLVEVALGAVVAGDGEGDGLAGVGPRPAAA